MSGNVGIEQMIRDILALDGSVYINTERVGLSADFGNEDFDALWEHSVDMDQYGGVPEIALQVAYNEFKTALVKERRLQAEILKEMAGGESD